MKFILTEESVAVPAGVEVSIKSKSIEVKGNVIEMI
jgi:ribosomal protein L6P/L9E